MTGISVFGGALRYEFRMQMRRRSIWLVLVLLSVLLFALWYLFENTDLSGYYHRVGGDHSNGPLIWVAPSQTAPILFWAQVLAMLLPVGVGLVLADRLARDHQAHVDEIFDTLPGSLGARLAGKWLGSTLATLIPVALIYAVVIAYIMIRVPGLQALPLAAAAFAAILLPGILFVAGFSIAIPAVLKVPVYQFLFIGYWFWANLMSPKVGLPSPAGTWLNAAGPWASEGIFRFQWTFLRLNATPAQAGGSIALLVGLGMSAIAGAWAFLRWQQARR
jgi:hypothetical protein